MLPKYWIFSVLSINLVFIQITHVVAEDDGEFGDIAQVFGNLAIGFLIVSFIVGLILFLNRYKSIREIIKKLHIPMKILWKGHHPLTIVTFIFWIIHGILMLQGGEDGSGSGWVIGVVLGILLTSGVLFSYIKMTNKYRKLFRIIHLILAIATIVTLIIHVE